MLDLTDPRSFRNLAKPVGALNAERLKQILERYESFQDPDIPPFMYGCTSLDHHLLIESRWEQLRTTCSDSNRTHPTHCPCKEDASMWQTDCSPMSCQRGKDV